jgi:hypothetical protein
MLKLPLFAGSSRTNKLIVLAAVFVIVIAGIAVILTRAAGFFVAVEPESAALTANAKLIADSRASGGKAIQFTAPVPSPPPPPPLGSSPWPDATNTGVPAGACPNGFHVVTGDDSSNLDGEVINCFDFHKGIDVYANNVTITNSIFRCEGGQGVWLRAGHHGLHIDHSEFCGGADGHTFTQGVGAITGITISRPDGAFAHDINANIVDHANIHHIMTGVIPDGGVTMRNSYVHDLALYDSQVHAGGVHFMDLGYTLMEHNRVDGGSTANIFIQEDQNDDGQPESHITMNDNYFPGVTFTNDQGVGHPTWGIQANSTGFASTIIASNNVFNHLYSSGPGNPDLPWSSANWFGNKFEDGSPVPVPH